MIMVILIDKAFGSRDGEGDVCGTLGRCGEMPEGNTRIYKHTEINVGD